MNFFKTTDSSRTFGRPSYFELNTNKSDFLIYGYGFSRKFFNLTNFVNLF